MSINFYGFKPIAKVENLSICVQPMNNFIDWQALIQFIEVWRSAGCTKFYVYVSSATPLVMMILEVCIKRRI